MPEWLIYHDNYRALVCRKHGYALLNLHSHLKKQHPELTLEERNNIVTNHSDLDFADLSEHPLCRGFREPITAIDGLTIHRGYACTRTECGYLTTSWKCLRNHNNEQHQAEEASHGRRRSNVSVQSQSWTGVHMQTFLTGPRSAVRYFCVKAPEAGPSTPPQHRSPTVVRPGPAGPRWVSTGAGGSSDGCCSDEHRLVTNIKEQWMEDQAAQEALQRVLEEGVLRHETTNWLKRTGWSAHFAGRDLLNIQLHSRMPGREDDVLRRLNAAVDLVFFGRCVDGLKNMPLMTRLLLASPHPHDAHSRPFGPLQEKTSMDRYLVYFKRFLCYCMNVLSLGEEQLFVEHALRFTNLQRRALEDLWDHLRDDEWPEEAIQEEVLQVSSAFWMQRLDGDPFVSPLWHFVGVLGIDGESGQLRPAHLFTYVLAGLVYVGRALLAEWAIPTRERDEMTDLPQRFARVRHDWLCKATHSPMGYVLSLLLYGRKIAQETGSRLMVSWSRLGELMYFMGKPILMDSLRTMIASMTTDAEDLLWTSLMFKEGEDVRFAVPLSSIEDDLTLTVRGQSFVHRNGLDGKEVEMLNDLVTGCRKREFIDDQGEWRWAGIRKYLKSVRKFEELLLILTHMTGGQPSRGEEITGLRLVNGINRDRSVFVIDGEVVLVTQYHKSLAHFDSPKVIPRFLPPRIDQLMAMYIIYIRPLTDRWEAERLTMCGATVRPQSDFIWHNESTGLPWESSEMSRALTKWSYHYLGQRITLQDWRHIAIAISKKHARQRGVNKADFAAAEDEDESEQYEVPDDLAASHTGRTAAHYGVTIDVLKRLTEDSLEVFGQVSRRWHRFLQCSGEEQLPAAETSPVLKRKEMADGISLTSTTFSSPSKRPKQMHSEAPTTQVNQSDPVLRALRAVLRDDNACFRSPEQEAAVRAAAAKASPLVAVLPTGGGKSLLFMVPAMLSGSGVTIVVAPFAELKRQLVIRCRDVGLDCEHWPQARETWPRITLVSAEAAVSDDFLQWAADLSVRGRLDRVVIDECHLLFTAADEYRMKLRGLVLLRNLACPFVFLTGTLPPLRQREFEEAMYLQEPKYIRASSHRVTARYAVLRVPNNRGIAEVKMLVDSWLERRPQPGEKGVIYCTSHAKCRTVAQYLNCHYYHGRPGDYDAYFLAQREAGLQAWVRGETPYIVATAALGTGIDVPGITHIIHLGAPHSIIDYAQEAGRAGRAGEPVTAHIIVEEKDWPEEDATRDSYTELKVREVNMLVRTRGCRRRILGQCLDSDSRDCKEIGAVRCDNCEQAELVWRSEPPFQGIAVSQARNIETAHALERMEAALEEIEGLGQLACRICWMFKGAEQARHKWYACSSIDQDLSFQSCMNFQKKINYRKDEQAQFLSCFHCHVSQALCRDGFQNQGATCRWKHIIIPSALAAITEEGLWLQIEKLAGRDFSGRAAYQDWLGRRHRKLVCGKEMTNAMAAFQLILGWRIAQKIS